MKKMLPLFAGITLLAGANAALMVFGISTAYAAGAIVQMDTGGCSLLDGNGKQITGTLDYKSKLKVSTESANGNLNLSCRLDNVPNDTGRAVNYSPANGDYYISDPRYPGADPRKADQWHATVSASGQAIVSCHAKTP